jgi:hypothetical protein
MEKLFNFLKFDILIAKKSIIYLWGIGQFAILYMFTNGVVFFVRRTDIFGKENYEAYLINILILIVLTFFWRILCEISIVFFKIEENTEY